MFDYWLFKHHLLYGPASGKADKKPVYTSSFEVSVKFKLGKFQPTSSSTSSTTKANLFFLPVQATPDLLVQTLLCPGVPFVSKKLSNSLDVLSVISLNIQCKIGNEVNPNSIEWPQINLCS